MFSSFCDSFCCCLYHLRHCFHDTQDSSHTRNKYVESRLRPQSYGVYPSFADTMRDYSRSVHEQPESSAIALSCFQQEDSSKPAQEIVVRSRSDCIESNSFQSMQESSGSRPANDDSMFCNQPNRSAPMEFSKSTTLSSSHDTIQSNPQNPSVMPHVIESMPMKPIETNLARNSRACFGRLDDMPSATDFQAANTLGQEQ